MLHNAQPGCNTFVVNGTFQHRHVQQYNASACGFANRNVALDFSITHVLLLR